MTEYEAKEQIRDIKNDLSRIIKDLYGIAEDLRGENFQGIGTEMCAGAITDVARNYEKVYNRLSNINISEVMADMETSEA